jgi:hypothetical protein
VRSAALHASAAVAADAAGLPPPEEPALFVHADDDMSDVTDASAVPRAARSNLDRRPASSLLGVVPDQTCPVLLYIYGCCCHTVLCMLCLLSTIIIIIIIMPTILHRHCTQESQAGFRLLVLLRDRQRTRSLRLRLRRARRWETASHGRSTSGS